MVNLHREAERNTPEPTPGYLPIHHPVTRRFMFAIDPQRGIIRVRDNGQDAFIDLAQYGWGKVEERR